MSKTAAGNEEHSIATSPLHLPKYTYYSSSTIRVRISILVLAQLAVIVWCLQLLELSAMVVVVVAGPKLDELRLELRLYYILPRDCTVLAKPIRL